MCAAELINKVKWCVSTSRGPGEDEHPEQVAGNQTENARHREFVGDDRDRVAVLQARTGSFRDPRRSTCRRVSGARHEPPHMRVQEALVSV